MTIEIDWTQVAAGMRAEIAAEDVFTPYRHAVVLNAMDAVRARIEASDGEALRPPALIGLPKPRREGHGAPGVRPRAALMPTEATLFHMLGAALAPAIERTLDRRRVFSAWPASDARGGFFAPWGEAHARRVAALRAALEDAPTCRAVRLDVRAFSASLDRDRVIGEAIALVGDPAVAALAERATAPFAATIGARGLPQTPMTAYLLGTFALRRLDAWCAAEGVASFRVVDNVTLLAADDGEADRLVAGARAALAPDGFELRHDPADRRDRATALADLDERATVIGARRADASDARSLARRLIADFASLGRHQEKAEALALVTLARAGDDSAVDHALGRFADAPTATQALALYLARFAADTTVRTAFARMVEASASRLDEWQWHWAMAVLAAGSALASPVAREVHRAAEKAESPLLRAAAAVVWSRFATAAGRAALDEIAAATDQAPLRAAIAFGCRWRPAAERRARLAAWDGDSDVRLVAAALARESDDSAAAMPNGA